MSFEVLLIFQKLGLVHRLIVLPCLFIDNFECSFLKLYLSIRFNKNRKYALIINQILR